MSDLAEQYGPSFTEDQLNALAHLEKGDVDAALSIGGVEFVSKIIEEGGGKLPVGENVDTRFGTVVHLTTIYPGRKGVVLRTVYVPEDEADAVIVALPSEDLASDEIVGVAPETLIYPAVGEPKHTKVYIDGKSRAIHVYDDVTSIGERIHDDSAFLTLVPCEDVDQRILIAKRAVKSIIG